MKATDYASVLEALHNENALATHFAQREALTGPSAEFCQTADCDMPIPQNRRQAIPGVQRCAQCQSLLERNRR